MLTPFNIPGSQYFQIPKKHCVIPVIFSSTSAASFDSAPRSSSLWHRGMGIRKEMLILYHVIQHTCIYIYYMLTFLIKWSQMCDYGVSSCQLNLALPSLFVWVLKHIRPQRVRFLLRIAGHSWLPQWHRAERLRAGCKQQAIQMWIYLDIFSCSPFVANSSWTNIEFVMIVSTASKTCFNTSLKQILNPIQQAKLLSICFIYGRLSACGLGNTFVL